MNLRVVTIGDAIVLEGRPTTHLLRSPEDVVELVGNCWEHDTRLVLLYAPNLSERFFDLSSGEAGTILQTLRNYRVKLAMVVDAERTPQSTRFGELASEERYGDDFRLFDDRAAAQAWLLQAG